MPRPVSSICYRKHSIQLVSTGQALPAASRVYSKAAKHRPIHHTWCQDHSHSLLWSLPQLVQIEALTSSSAGQVQSHQRSVIAVKQDVCSLPRHQAVGLLAYTLNPAHNRPWGDIRVLGFSTCGIGAVCVLSVELQGFGSQPRLGVLDQRDGTDIDTDNVALCVGRRQQQQRQGQQSCKHKSRVWLLTSGSEQAPPELQWARPCRNTDLKNITEQMDEPLEAVVHTARNRARMQLHKLFLPLGQGPVSAKCPFVRAAMEPLVPN